MKIRRPIVHPSQTELLCTKCGETKPRTMFGTSYSGSPRSWCRPCCNVVNSIRKREQRAANKSGVHVRRRSTPRARTADCGPALGEQGGYEATRRERAMRGEKAFKLAMLAARRSRLESFVLGVDHTPGTDHPIFEPHRGIPTSGMSSPAALCAAMGAPEDERVSTFFR